MLLSPPLLFITLAATMAVAIDIHGYGRADTCTGAYLSCRNAKPGECCSFGGAAFQSMKWDLIPAGTQIQSYVFKGRDDGGAGRHCKVPARKAVLSKAGRTSVCVAAGTPLRGGKYVMPGTTAKRAGEDVEDVGEPVEERETGGDPDCLRANTLTLEDGTSFDLRSLDELSFQRLLEASQGAMDRAAIPEEFHAYIVRSLGSTT